eukprot:CAMPEP_0172363510 /NCGR_PEP_ID=MMETSP1060-20121228/6849_1 /TAXON_ID=37318 /ORGANISM="Pseudo-nitzschia pungens, Strain cf. cingulata" /LENGTH=556 /DNA_ID=CAMNT_0013086261 /DNA_START=178 /DNA_END=1848 /DNA_ORIENTATION=+
MAEPDLATAVNVDSTSDYTTENGMDFLQEPLLPPEVPADINAEDASGDRLLNILEPNAFPLTPEINESGWEHGEIQPNGCRDWFWGLLFLVQLAAVFTLAVMGFRNMIKEGSEWMPDDDDDHQETNRTPLWFLLSLVGSAIAISAFLASVLLGPFASMLIQISLVLPPLSLLVTAVLSLLTFNVPIALFSLILSAMGSYFAFFTWNKIPFATANLKIALSAIQDNHGLWILAYVVSVKAYVWVLLWSSAVSELVHFSPSWTRDCSVDETGELVCHMTTRGNFIALGMLLSFFWTNQVLNNIFHTTIAGVVGTWWFDPEEARVAQGFGGGCGCGCGCSPAIYNSWIRSNFHSFGSICFGSLLVGTLQVLNFIVRCGRKKRDEQRRLRGDGPNTTDLLCCLLQFVVEKMEFIMEYFNTWAFVYVGLYGYDYWTAGKQVSTLFGARGWSVIVNDQLVARSLSMMSWVISLITGIIAILLGFVILGASNAVSAAIPTFLFGAILGRASSQVLFGVVTSATDTVVVCFAESPNHLRNNHDPELFRGMVQAWRKAYPEECGF